MTKGFIKMLLSLATVFTVCTALMCVNVSADQADSQKTYGVRETLITKYFTVDGQLIPAGEGFEFNIYADVEGELTLIAQAQTDENGCFDLSDVYEVAEYMGFTDGNLHPDSADAKIVYIVDAESLEDPSAVSVANVNDEGNKSTPNTIDKIQSTLITVDGVEVPCVAYTFTNFFHTNLAGWRVGKNYIDPQFTIRGDSDVAVTAANWDFEWGVPIGDQRCFPTSGHKYFFRYSAEGDVFTFEFATDSQFENSTMLCTRLDKQATYYNYMLVWMRVPNGFSVEGEIDGNTFECVGGDGGFYEQAFYPALFPVDNVFVVEGNITFNYDQDNLAQLINLNGNEVMNYQFKSLYLPEASADFVSANEPPKAPEEDPEIPEEDPELPIDPPMSDTIDRAPETGDVRELMPVLTVALVALFCLAFCAPALIKNR